MPVFNARRSEASNIDFQQHTEISADSLNLLLILCTVVDEIFSLPNFPLRNVVLEFFHNLYFTSKKLCLSKILFKKYINNHVNDLLSVNPISCKISL